MKALFITGSNQYGVLSGFSQGMVEDLALLGIESMVFDTSNNDAMAEAVATFQQGMAFDFIISFNGLGLDWVIDGKKFLESLGKPLYIVLVDHPIHLLHRFIGTTGTVLCVDQEHVAFCNLCGMKAVFFPHAVAQSCMQHQPLVPYAQRSEQIIFPVSYFDVQHWRQELQPVWQHIEGLVEKSTSVTRFMQFFGVLPLGNQPARVQLTNNLLSLCRGVDFYLRAMSRQQCLSDFAAKGIALTVVGQGVNKYQQHYPLHNYLPAISSSELEGRIKQARFVLHNSPGFELGLHERIVQPLALGSHVLLDNVGYIERVIDGEVFFPDLVSITQLSESLYNEKAQKNQQVILSKHTWKKRFESLLSGML